MFLRVSTLIMSSSGTSQAYEDTHFVLVITRIIILTTLSPCLVDFRAESMQFVVTFVPVYDGSSCASVMLNLHFSLLVVIVTVVLLSKSKLNLLRHWPWYLWWYRWCTVLVDVSCVWCSLVYCYVAVVGLSRQAPGPTQAPVGWVSGLFPWGKAVGACRWPRIYI